MSGPFGSSQFMYATGALAEGSSLRFEDGDSAYLSFTPASAGNQKTWTWSGWIKPAAFGKAQPIFSAYTSSTNYTVLGFDLTGFIGGGDSLKLWGAISNSTSCALTTNAVFRDPSAWYHVLIETDTTQATAADRIKIYVNGDQVTSFSSSTYPAQNANAGIINAANLHQIGALASGTYGKFDGYIANVTFIDGTALDPTSFGEYEDTLWKPKSDTDIQALTFGTNGFYLPFDQTTEAEGFSTVTWVGNGGTQSIEGVGFEPDLIWGKRRNGTNSHWLVDSVRGAGKRLISNSTAAEDTPSGLQSSFDSNGFTLGSNTEGNKNSETYVAWCWDAGTGSAASNTDGSITSSVKANTTNGFSIVSYTGNGTAGATIGHGLSSAPEVMIIRNRDRTANWRVYTDTTGNTGGVDLDSTGGFYTATNMFNSTSPTASVFTVGTSSNTNQSGEDFISYMFHSVSGYSDFGYYTGTGASGNAVTTGFEPAFVMIKRSDASGDDWVMVDTTRSPVNPRDDHLSANSSAAETSGGNRGFDTSATGFTINHTGAAYNTSGGTYIYMAFKDTRDATFFGDTSGNSNNWTPNALNNTDVVPDSPVTNFATLNPLDKVGVSLSQGNLKTTATASSWQAVRSTITYPSGSWYAEVRSDAGTGNGNSFVGITRASDALSTMTGSNLVGTSSTAWGYASNGNIYNSNAVDTATGTTWSAGAIIGVAFDGSSVKFYKDNTLVHTESSLTGDYVLTLGAYSTDAMTANFGQDSSFAGNETPQGNTDANGQGDFYYAPPSGFLALTRNNLPSPDILDPTDYFNTVLYTGTGSSLSVTGANFQPDWTWIKKRSGAEGHALYDSVRGTTNRLRSDATTAENTGGLTSFDSDGFTVDGNYGTDGENGFTYAAWNWLAGGTAVSNTDGTITSSVSANTDAGFSVVGYTGTGSSATVGHGLLSAPEMIIVKVRSTTNNWPVYHTAIGNGNYLLLNGTAGSAAGGGGFWNGTTPSNSVVSLGSAGAVNASSATYIAYCFHSVESYSKCGVYTGNGSTDGTYVHLGFRPSWIMVKRTDAASSNGWYIYDNKRENYGTLVDAMIYANLSNAEDNGNRDLDFTANGFKPRITDSNVNASGGSYIFLAFSEAPFRNANAR